MSDKSKLADYLRKLACHMEESPCPVSPPAEMGTLPMDAPSMDVSIPLMGDESAAVPATTHQQVVDILSKHGLATEDSGLIDELVQLIDSSMSEEMVETPMLADMPETPETISEVDAMSEAIVPEPRVGALRRLG